MTHLSWVQSDEIRSAKGGEAMMSMAAAVSMCVCVRERERAFVFVFVRISSESFVSGAAVSSMHISHTHAYITHT